MQKVLHMFNTAFASMIQLYYGVMSPLPFVQMSHRSLSRILENYETQFLQIDAGFLTEYIYKDLLVTVHTHL